MKIKTLITPNHTDEYEYALTHLRDDSAEKDYTVIEDYYQKGVQPTTDDEKKRLNNFKKKLKTRNKKSVNTNIDVDWIKNFLHPNWKAQALVSLQEGLGLKKNQGATVNDLLPYAPGLANVKSKSQSPKVQEAMMAKVVNDNCGNYTNGLILEEKFYDETNNKIIDKAPNKKTVRSIDAGWYDDIFNLAISLKYKGGTDAGDGSTQLDQLLELHKGIGRMVENSDNYLNYNGKITFLILLVYGNQVNQPERIQKLEAKILAENSGPFKRVLTCSPDMLPKVAHEIKTLLKQGVAYDDICTTVLENCGHDFYLLSNYKKSYDTIKSILNNTNTDIIQEKLFVTQS